MDFSGHSCNPISNLNKVLLPEPGLPTMPIKEPLRIVVDT